MLPCFTRAAFGRQAESAVHEEAAGNKEVGRNETIGGSHTESPQPVPRLRQIESDQILHAFFADRRAVNQGALVFSAGAERQRPRGPGLSGYILGACELIEMSTSSPMFGISAFMPKSERLMTVCA